MNVQKQALDDALLAILSDLNKGALRVATPTKDHQWQVNEWVKQAIILYLNTRSASVMGTETHRFFDKVPMKYAGYTASDFVSEGVRVVPQASVRYGAHVGSNVVLMPCFVNLGAYIDTGCMIDTWATVGSCAQIGKRVHLSGGSGIGGVLEPIQAQPTIIEDDCFIGARAEIAEGVVVEQGSVIASGVFLTQSTKIYNRMTKTLLPAGRIPSGSVVVPGSLPVADSDCHQYAVIITKQVDAKTRAKTAINDLLRD